MTAAALPSAATTFALPTGSEASGPPERRGVPRDGVRLLVARPGSVEHRVFSDLPLLLEPGDLLVVNTSATVPAAVDGVHQDGRSAPVHLSTVLDDGDWVVEVRSADNGGPDRTTRPGQVVMLPGGVRLVLGQGYPDPGLAHPRLRRAAASPALPALEYLQGHGRPVEYGYLDARYSLDEHQTVYADQPGSAEMASAGRPFTTELLVRLMTRGVTVAPVVLHAGVSSAEAHEPPLPERFAVPTDTARLVTSARRAGRRVVAVGTTVVRALESAATPAGSVHAASGWTDLVLSPRRPARVVDGLVTGLHAPEASHLLLLEAVAGADLVRAAYDAALEDHYLWHEFGDSTLLLPPSPHLPH